MRTQMVEERIGENMGPIDWSHEWAKDMPPIWRDAEQSPGDFLINGRQIIAVAMYDGWPYWKPMPAIFREGPIGCEWDHFNSYGVHPNSITRKAPRTKAAQ